jgi:uncharacterized surface protein with fasciclin (FAS1) repeats
MAMVTGGVARLSPADRVDLPSTRSDGRIAGASRAAVEGIVNMTRVNVLVLAALGLCSPVLADGCGSSKTAGDDAGATVMPVSYGGDAKAAPATAKDIVDTAAGNKDFSTLVTAIQAAGLAETLKGKGPFTVFAPTNAAFAKIDPKALQALLKDKAALTQVLTHHVVPGNVLAADVTKLTFADTVGGQRLPIAAAEGVRVGAATVVTTDIRCSNGVIHVIDAVLMPETKDVIGVAGAAGQFTTLARLIDAAGLGSTLQGPGPFTVFAPTDAAFAKLPKETVDSLLKPENKARLASILTYHVVPGRVFSDQAVKAGTAKTVQGQNVTIAVKDGKAMVNTANIVKTDINASNGVIHVIDTVILPKD